MITERLPDEINPVAEEQSRQWQRDKPQGEPKHELEDLNQWLTEPILRKEVMPKMMGSDRCTVEFNERGEAMRVVVDER